MKEIKETKEVLKWYLYILAAIGFYQLNAEIDLFPINTVRDITGTIALIGWAALLYQAPARAYKNAWVIHKAKNTCKRATIWTVATFTISFYLLAFIPLIIQLIILNQKHLVEKV